MNSWAIIFDMRIANIYRLVFCLVLGFGFSGAHAQVCAPPSSLANATANGPVNNYYAGNGNLSVGSTALTLGTRDARVATVALEVGGTHRSGHTYAGRRWRGDSDGGVRRDGNRAVTSGKVVRKFFDSGAYC